MNFKALVSPIALASALALTGGAFAQDAEMEAGAEMQVEGPVMIGDRELTSEGDIAAVRSYCEDLENDQDDASPGEIAGAQTDDMNAADDRGLDEITSGINFETITLTQCDEGGFLDGTEGEATMEGDAEMEVDG